MSDATIASVGRRMAETLMKFAHDRRDEDRKAIAQVQSELCAAVRAEAEEDRRARQQQESTA